MLPSTDPDRLSNKEGSRGAQDSPWEVGNKMDFAGGLGVGGDGTRRDQIAGMEGESTVRDWDWRVFR